MNSSQPRVLGIESYPQGRHATRQRVLPTEQGAYEPCHGEGMTVGPGVDPAESSGPSRGPIAEVKFRLPQAWLTASISGLHGSV